MYQKILVPLDGSSTAARGLAEAVRLAPAFGSSLVLLHVIDDFPMSLEMASVPAYEETIARFRTSGQKLLEAAQASAQAAEVPAETRLREITSERIGSAIIDEALENGCGLIVMGTHGRRGFNRVMMDSDAEFVTRASPVPVLLVRSGAED